MAHSNAAAKRRQAEEHNAQYERNKNKRKAEALFDYLAILVPARTRAVEELNKARQPKRSSFQKQLMVATVMAALSQ